MLVCQVGPSGELIGEHPEDRRTGCITFDEHAADLAEGEQERQPTPFDAKPHTSAPHHPLASVVESAETRFEDSTEFVAVPCHQGMQHLHEQLAVDVLDPHDSHDVVDDQATPSGRMLSLIHI